MNMGGMRLHAVAKVVLGAHFIKHPPRRAQGPELWPKMSGLSKPHALAGCCSLARPPPSRTPLRGAARGDGLKMDLRKAGVGSTSMHKPSQQPTPWASKLRLDHVIHAQQSNNFTSKTGSAQTLHVVQLDPTRETTSRSAATSKPRLDAYAQPGKCKRSSPPRR